MSASTAKSRPIRPLAAPRGITVGADGNLWFAEQNASKIGCITTAGAFCNVGTSGEIATATAASDPFGIAAGPDGNLWFTEVTAATRSAASPPPGHFAASGQTAKSRSPPPRSDSACHHCGAERCAVVHRISWWQDRPHHDRRCDKRILHRYPGRQRAPWHYDRAGRQSVVYRI